MDALRAFIVSGVESATCLLLQEKFEWNHDTWFRVYGLFPFQIKGIILLEDFSEARKGPT